jgi:putative peptidoglycan lipid II flippase
VAGWTFAGVALSQAAFVVTSQVVNSAGNRAEAGGLPGGRTVFDNAYLLFMLPHSLVAVSLVTAVFTRMSAAAGQGRVDAVRDDLSYTLRSVGTATVLSTVAFLALAPDLTRGLFLGSDRGATDAYAAVATAMLLGLVPFSAQYLFQRVFYAFEDARTPFLVTALTTVLWTVGNLLSRALLAPEHVAIGVGVALSASSAVGVAVTLVPLRRRLGTMDGARVLRTHVRLGVAGAGAGAAAVAVRLGVHAVLGQTRTASYAVILLAGGTLVVGYLTLLRVLRVTELDDLLQPVTNRLRRA